MTDAHQIDAFLCWALSHLFTETQVVASGRAEPHETTVKYSIQYYRLLPETVPRFNQVFYGSLFADGIGNSDLNLPAHGIWRDLLWSVGQTVVTNQFDHNASR